MLLLLLQMFSALACIILVQSVEVWQYPQYRGWVLDARTKAPLEHAQVTWNERELTIKTDTAGGFIVRPEIVRRRLTAFEAMSTIDHFVVRHPGYADHEITHDRLKFAEKAIDLGTIELDPS